MARVIIRKIDQEKMIRQLLEGNTSAFEQLFRLYFPRLRKYDLSFLKEPAEAEDLVQEVFFQVWNSRTYLTPGKPLSSWLHTLVRNRCLNALKKLAKDPPALHIPISNRNTPMW